jgi:hypothetical protein
MTNKISIIPLATSESYSPDVILEVAKEQLDAVIVIGYTKEGKRYFASSTADGPEVVWMMEKAKLDLLNIGD